MQMKDSKISWIGEIPNHWKVLPNKYIFNISKNIVDNPEKYQLLSLTTKGVKDKDENDLGGKIPDNYNGYQRVNKGDLILCLFDLDCSAVFSGLSNYKGMISPAYKIANSKKGVGINNYFKYLFAHAFNGRHYKQYSKSLRFTVNSDEFLRIKSIVPSLDEQIKISNYLDKKCGEIDDLIADIEKEIEILTQYKKSVITETVTKGLNKDITLKNSGIEWAKQTPEHWKIIPNKYLMKKIKNICPKYTDEKILSLTMNGVIVRDLDAGGKMPTSFDGYQIVKPGNLLMCLFDIDVTPRCVGLVKDHGLTSPAYSQFAMKEKAYAPYYYYYYLMLDYTKELLHLAKNLRHSFTEEQLGIINTPVPPIQEQKEIAEYLDKKCKEIDSILEDKNKQLETLETYKKSIIYEYVTGKKEVEND